MKHHGIESKLNAIKTSELIEDIKIFSGSFVQSMVNYDEENICTELNKIIPDYIDVNELFNKYESNDKESNQLLLFIRAECLDYNKMLRLVKTDITNVISCKYGDTTYDVDEIKEALVMNRVPKNWSK
jgi:hypothetical protein